MVSTAARPAVVLAARAPPGASTTGAPGGPGPSTDAFNSTSSFVNDDGGTCEKYQVQAARAAPDMLIVMDASGSMVGVSASVDDLLGLLGGGNTRAGVDRWTPAVDAVNTLTSELERDIQFGLMVFPAGGIGCGAGNLDVPMDIMNAEPIATALALTLPALGRRSKPRWYVRSST